MKRFLRILLTCSLVATITIGVIAASSPTKLRRLAFVLQLFSNRNHNPDFQNMGSLFPTKVVRKSDHPFAFVEGTTISFPPQYLYKDHARDSVMFLRDVDTTGLLILHRDRVIYENYWRSTQPTTKTIGWSLTKSFVSALVGIAIAEGKIGSVNDTVTQYVPELKDTAYDGVKLKDVLQMSSGASWKLEI